MCIFLQVIWKNISVLQQKIGSRFWYTLTPSVVLRIAANRVDCRKPYEHSSVKLQNKLQMMLMSWEPVLLRRTLVMVMRSHMKTL